jgi:hypothetical protein
LTAASIASASASARRSKEEKQQLLSYSISTLLTRNLNDVFGENDPTRRRAAIDEMFTEDYVSYDPTGGVYRDRDEIDRIAGEVRATHPDFRYQPLAEPEEVGTGGWGNLTPSRSATASGASGTCESGRPFWRQPRIPPSSTQTLSPKHCRRLSISMPELPARSRCRFAKNNRERFRHRQPQKSAENSAGGLDRCGMRPELRPGFHSQTPSRRPTGRALRPFFRISVSSETLVSGLCAAPVVGGWFETRSVLASQYKDRMEHRSQSLGQFQSVSPPSIPLAARVPCARLPRGRLGSGVAEGQCVQQGPRGLGEPIS